MARSGQSNPSSRTQAILRLNEASDIRFVTPLVMLALVGILCVLAACTEAEPQGATAGGPDKPDPLNTAYTLDGVQDTVTLVDGRSEAPAAPNSAARVLTAVWGDPILADFSGDGREDAVLVLTQTRGGSGTFYYLAAAVREDDGYRAIGGAFLGDRILPQTVGVEGKRITVAYLDRNAGEAMATPPSQPRERMFVYDTAGGGHLAVVAQDFEGEADPARMDLQMKTWAWRRTLYNNDTVEEPNEPGAFTLTFEDDGRVLIGTDCNTMRGSYQAEGKRLQFSTVMGTRMYCEGSQEGLFTGALEQVNGYLFTGRGQLVLELRYDTGSMIFQ